MINYLNKFASGQKMEGITQVPSIAGIHLWKYRNAFLVLSSLRETSNVPGFKLTAWPKIKTHEHKMICLCISS